MNTKLTLRLDDSLIDAAKNYAAREGRSVSELVAAYFSRLDAPGLKATGKATTGGRKSSFYGLLVPSKTQDKTSSGKSKQTATKFDEKAYRAHLVQKHQ